MEGERERGPSSHNKSCHNQNTVEYVDQHTTKFDRNYLELRTTSNDFLP